MQARWKVPFVIQKQISKNTFQIKNQRTGKIMNKVQSGCILKIYTRTTNNLDLDNGDVTVDGQNTSSEVEVQWKPVTRAWQLATCKKFDIPYRSRIGYGKSIGKVPSTCLKTKDDCLFPTIYLLL